MQGVLIQFLVRKLKSYTHALQAKNQTVEQKQYCNKFIKDFLNGPHFKNCQKVTLSHLNDILEIIAF